MIVSRWQDTQKKFQGGTERLPSCFLGDVINAPKEGFITIKKWRIKLKNLKDISLEHSLDSGDFLFIDFRGFLVYY
jgi:hypothetical protein